MLKKSGKILAEIMQRLKGSVKAGVLTAEIDELAEKLVNKEKYSQISVSSLFKILIAKKSKISNIKIAKTVSWVFQEHKKNND